MILPNWSTAILVGFAVVMAGPADAFPAPPATPQATAAATAQQVDDLVAKAGAIDATKDAEASLAAWTAATEKARQLKPLDPMRLARALNGTADPVYNLFNQRKGQDAEAALGGEIVLLVEARDLLRANGLTHSDLYIDLMSNLGATYAPLPNFPAAEAAQREGVAIGEDMYGRDSPKLSHNYFNLGMLMFRQKHYGDAADFVGRSARIRARTEPDMPETVSALGTATQVSADAGRIKEAEELALLGVTLSGHLPDHHPFRGYALAQLGEVYRRQGRYAEDLPLLRKGLDLLALDAGKTHVFTYRALVSLSQTLAARGQFEEARALLDPYRTFVKSVDLTMALRTEIARDDAETGRLDNALADIDDAIGYTNGKTYSPEGSIARARALEFKSDLLAANGDDARATSAAQEAVTIYGRHLSPETATNAAARARLGFLTGAAGYADLASAAGDLQTSLFETASQEAISTRFAQYRDPFVRLALAAHARGDDARAFDALELASFNPVAEAAARSTIRQRGKSRLASGLLEKFEALQRQATALRVQRDQAYASGDTVLSQTLAAQLMDTTVQARDVRSQLRAAFPVYDVLSRPDHTQLADIQSRLRPGDTILIVIPGTFSTAVARISRTRFAMDQRKLSHFELRRHVTAIRASLVPDAEGELPPFARDAAATLYNALFVDDGHDTLKDTSRLYVMALDEAGQVPYSLLLTRPVGPRTPLRDAPWLIRRMSIATLASFSTPLRQGRQKAISFVGMGAPSLSGPAGQLTEMRGFHGTEAVDLAALSSLPSLPGTAIELRRLRAALRGKDGVLLLGDQAREPALSAFAGKSIHVLAFATHGLFSGDITGLAEPALVLTPPPEATAADDGLLSASEIMALHLKADWVVLSACDSASGSTDGAAGFRGLAQAFLYGGAHTLLASQWAVRDDAVMPLTLGTTVARGDRADALRQAELRMIKDRSHPDRAHPALWAPFVVMQMLEARPPS